MASLLDLYRNVFGGEADQGAPMAVQNRQGGFDPYQPAAVPDALELLKSATGYTDLEQAGQAYGRGEYLPALGQGAWGAAQAASTAFPVLKAGGAALRAGAPLAREAASAIPGLLADEAGAIRAYHGSPHSFDRFDLSKIGTGEGAQAYGHGLYFAEAEDVARGYKSRLSGLSDTGYGRKPSALEKQGLDIVNRTGVSRRWDASPTEIRQQLIDNYSNTLANAPEEAIYGGRASVERDVAALRALDPSLFKPPGHMYEVDIHADPKAFLDWDRSLAGQSPEVLTALQQKLGQPAGLPPGMRLRQTGSGDYMVVDDLGMGASGKGGVVARGRTPEEALRLYLPSGGELYQDIAKKLGGTREKITPAGSYNLPYSSESQASERLREAGIPGIRYLDQGSRGAGTGTSNYAIFDDKLIEILRKYGILPPAIATGGLLATQPEPPT